MGRDEELRLVRLARLGDKRAFADLVNDSQSAVRGFLYRFSGHWGDADDLSQEAFVVAWSRLRDFRGNSSFRSWVCGIGFRLALRARRSHQRTLVRQGEWVRAQEPGVGCADDRLMLEAEMAKFPDPQRAAIALCLGEGFTHSEAAQILGLPLGTVKSHVTRGREKLLRAFRDLEGDRNE